MKGFKHYRNHHKLTVQRNKAILAGCKTRVVARRRSAASITTLSTSQFLYEDIYNLRVLFLLAYFKFNEWMENDSVTSVSKTINTPKARKTLLTKGRYTTVMLSVNLMYSW